MKSLFFTFLLIIFLTPFNSHAEEPIYGNYYFEEFQNITVSVTEFPSTIESNLPTFPSPSDVLVTICTNNNHLVGYALAKLEIMVDNGVYGDYWECVTGHLYFESLSDTAYIPQTYVFNYIGSIKIFYRTAIISSGLPELYNFHLLSPDGTSCWIAELTRY